MAERNCKAIRRGGRYCVAGAPNNQSCRNTSYTPGVRMHQFPADPLVRAKWIKFVQRHRVDFAEPINKYASLCSAHFEQNCYSSSYSLQLDGMTDFKKNKVLIKGSVPTRHTVLIAGPEVPTEREKRQVSVRNSVLWHFF